MKVGVYANSPSNSPEHDENIEVPEISPLADYAFCNALRKVT
jgi:hypothetical protein